LAWAEYCYNTSYHSALRATPFEVVYGRSPPPLLAYRAGSARTDTVDGLLRDRDEVLAEIRERLLQAQQISKKYYDASHRELEFAVGDWVWLRLLHRTTHRRGVWYILVQLHGLPAEEATWEQRQEFQDLYPAFQLEDELFVEGGRDVMTGITYARRHRSG